MTVKYPTIRYTGRDRDGLDHTGIVRNATAERVVQNSYRAGYQAMSVTYRGREVARIYTTDDGHRTWSAEAAHPVFWHDCWCPDGDGGGQWPVSYCPRHGTAEAAREEFGEPVDCRTLPPKPLAEGLDRGPQPCVECEEALYLHTYDVDRDKQPTYYMDWETGFGPRALTS